MATCTDCGQKFKDYVTYTKHQCKKGTVPEVDKILGKYLSVGKRDIKVTEK